MSNIFYTISGIGISLNDMHFAGDKSTFNSTYLAVASFAFSGTDRLGVPESIKAILSVFDGAYPGDIRIYDVTNSNVIAELTGITETAKTIKDLGTLSNLPTDEAIWEIQIRIVTGTSERVYLYSLSVLF